MAIGNKWAHIRSLLKLFCQVSLLLVANYSFSWIKTLNFWLSLSGNARNNQHALEFFFIFGWKLLLWPPWHFFRDVHRMTHQYFSPTESLSLLTVLLLLFFLSLLLVVSIFLFSISLTLCSLHLTYSLYHYLALNIVFVVNLLIWGHCTFLFAIIKQCRANMTITCHSYLYHSSLLLSEGRKTELSLL